MKQAALLSVLLLAVSHALAQGTCQATPASPWYEMKYPSKATPERWLDYHNAPVKVIDLINPVPATVCTGGGPTNSIAVQLQLRNGAQKTIQVREEGCIDLFVPKITIGPGCVPSDIAVCAALMEKYRCVNIPQVPPRKAFWSQGWSYVAPDTSDSVIKSIRKSTGMYKENIEGPLPLQYLFVSQTLKTVKVCSSTQPITVYVATSDPFSETPDLIKNVSSCQFIQGKAMWVKPEELPVAVVINYQVTW